MANIVISYSLLETDLNSLTLPSMALYTYETAWGDILYCEFDSEPTVRGNTQTYKNPTFYGELGFYNSTGTTKVTYDNDDYITAATSNYTAWKVTDEYDGVLNIKGSLSYSYTYNPKTEAYKASYSVSTSGFSYKASDGSSWQLTAAISEKSSYNSSTETETYSYSSTITGFSSSDGEGNSLSFSGKYVYNNDSEEYSGYMTSMNLNLGGTKLSISGLKISYDEITSEEYSISSVEDMLPSLLSGNDTISLKADDHPDGVCGYAGNDKINGSKEDDILWGDAEEEGTFGNDTLIGGAGDDALVGCGGNDSLDGGEGDDWLYGGDGTNKLIGGKGDDELHAYGLKDTLTGGAGSDIFMFYNWTDESTETLSAMNAIVTDFQKGIDSIYLNSEWNVMTEENFMSGRGMKSSSDEYVLFVYDTASGVLYYDQDSNGSDKGIVIATFTGKPSITEADFTSIFY